MNWFKLPWDNKKAEGSVGPPTLAPVLQPNPTTPEKNKSPATKNAVSNTRAAEDSPPGIQQMHHALQSATSSITKARHSAAAAREELDQYHKLQAKFAKEQLELESKAANRDMLDFFGRLNPATLAANMLVRLPRPLLPAAPSRHDHAMQISCSSAPGYHQCDTSQWQESRREQ